MIHEYRNNERLLPIPIDQPNPWQQDVSHNKVCFRYKSTNQRTGQPQPLRQTYFIQTFPVPHIQNVADPYELNPSKSIQFKETDRQEENPAIHLHIQSGSKQIKYIPSGKRLPLLPNSMNHYQVEQVEKVHKSNTTHKKAKETFSKSRLCSILPWIIAGLLLLAFVTILILYLINRSHHNQQTQTKLPCEIKYIEKNELKCNLNTVSPLQEPSQTQDYPLPSVFDQEQKQPKPIYGYSNPNPIDIFYGTDHTNYQYTHLRKHFKSNQY